LFRQMRAIHSSCPTSRTFTQTVRQ
jgi:hypothetical protein